MAPERTPTERAALASVGAILRAGLERIKENRPPAVMASLETEKPGANPASHTPPEATDGNFNPSQ